MEQFTVLLDKKRKYKGSLPCPQCGRSLLHGCIKNGVRYVQGRKGRPEKIWNADLHKCDCGILVLTDFGRVSEWNKKTVIAPGLQELIDAWLAHNARAEGIPSDPGHRIVILYSWQFKDNAAQAQAAVAPNRLLALSIGERRAAA